MIIICIQRRCYPGLRASQSTSGLVHAFRSDGTLHVCCLTWIAARVCHSGMKSWHVPVHVTHTAQGCARPRQTMHTVELSVDHQEHTCHASILQLQTCMAPLFTAQQYSTAGLAFLKRQSDGSAHAEDNKNTNKPVYCLVASVVVHNRCCFDKSASSFELFEASRWQAPCSQELALQRLDAVNCCR